MTTPARIKSQQPAARTEGIDRNVESVITKHRSRAEAGLRKYGVTTERTDLSLKDWLTHLQEELLDAAVYVEAMLAPPAEPAAPISEERSALANCAGVLEALWASEHDGTALCQHMKDEIRQAIDSARKALGISGDAAASCFDESTREAQETIRKADADVERAGRRAGDSEFIALDDLDAAFANSDVFPCVRNGVLGVSIDTHITMTTRGDIRRLKEALDRTQPVATQDAVKAGLGPDGLEHPAKSKDAPPAVESPAGVEEAVDDPWAWAVVGNRRLRDMHGDKCDRLICFSREDADRFAEPTEEGEEAMQVVELYPRVASPSPPAEQGVELPDSAFCRWVRSDGDWVVAITHDGSEFVGFRGVAFVQGRVGYDLPRGGWSKATPADGELRYSEGQVGAIVEKWRDENERLRGEVDSLQQLGSVRERHRLGAENKRIRESLTAAESALAEARQQLDARGPQ